MTRKEAKEVLARCFGRLDDERLGNLEWHRQRGTPIFRGLDAHYVVADSKTGFA